MMDDNLKLPTKWLKCAWVERFCTVVQEESDGNHVLTTGAIDEPDLFLWIRSVHYPQLTAKQYRNALRDLTREQRPGYKASPIRDDLREMLDRRIKEKGKRRWAAQVCKLDQPVSPQYLESLVAKTTTLLNELLQQEQQEHQQRQPNHATHIGGAGANSDHQTATGSPDQADTDLASSRQEHLEYIAMTFGSGLIDNNDTRSQSNTTSTRSSCVSAQVLSVADVSTNASMSTHVSGSSNSNNASNDRMVAGEPMGIAIELPTVLQKQQQQRQQQRQEHYHQQHQQLQQQQLQQQQFQQLQQQQFQHQQQQQQHHQHHHQHENERQQERQRHNLHLQQLRQLQQPQQHFEHQELQQQQQQQGIDIGAGIGTWDGNSTNSNPDRMVGVKKRFDVCLESSTQLRFVAAFPQHHQYPEPLPKRAAIESAFDFRNPNKSHPQYISPMLNGGVNYTHTTQPEIKMLAIVENSHIPDMAKPEFKVMRFAGEANDDDENDDNDVSFNDDEYYDDLLFSSDLSHVENDNYNNNNNLGATLDSDEGEEDFVKEFDDAMAKFKDFGLMSKSQYCDLEKHYTSCFLNPGDICFMVYFTDRHWTGKTNSYVNRTLVEFVGVDMTEDMHVLNEISTIQLGKELLSMAQPGEVVCMPGVWMNCVDKHGNAFKVMCDAWVPAIKLNGNEAIYIFAPVNSNKLLRQPGLYVSG